MNKLSALIIMLLFAGIHIQAQNLDIEKTLQWKVVSVENKTTNEVLSRASEVVVYGSDSIEWSQPEAERVYTFSIKSLSGNWKDAGVDGVISYEVQVGESKGTLTFQRQGSKITIDFSLKRGEQTTFPFILFIESIQPK